MDLKIAIIDRGIEHTHDRLHNANIEGVTISYGQHGFHYKDGHEGDSSGHGTAIAGIIYKMAPELPLVSVKLLGKNDVMDEGLLCEGIRWCTKNDEVKVINISLGIATRSPSKMLYDVCRDATDKGKIIIAACHNYYEKQCFPAYFPFVYSVASGIVKNKFDFKFLGDGHVNLLAKGTTQRTCWKNNSLKISSGTSYATAHITAIVGNFLRDNLKTTNPDVKLYLETHSSSHITELNYQKLETNAVVGKYSGPELEEIGEALFKKGSLLPFAKDLALIPAYDKEINTLLEFSQYSNSNVKLAVGYPRMLDTGINTISPSVPVTKKMPEEGEFGKFDTVVVGYIFSNLFDANILFSKRFIDKALQLNKNFITWDRSAYEYIKKTSGEYPEYQGIIRFVCVDDRIFEKTKHFQGLPPITTPVLSVIGTSNKQGKITTQLRIKSILEEEGYRVSHLATEPQNILLGADFVFPYGGPENTENIYIDSSKWNLFLHCAIKGIQHYNSPHLILTGTQGGVVPRAVSFGEPRNAILSSLNFLTSVQPDVCVCAINPQDTLEIILNTMNVMEIYCKSKVLFFVMTPWLREFQDTGEKALASHKVLNKSQMTERMELFENQLHIPVFDIMDDKNDKRILQLIQDFFSKHE